MTKEFLMGNEAIVRGAIAAGAKMMTGYPITPTTEIMEYWVKAGEQRPELKFSQSEDEMAAGFAMLGACLAGVKAFSATAGPGNILMQDAFSMAENMRIPTVSFINQRGGPSTGTVIYSQQELNLTCFGGNGEGLRIVYATANVQELYDYAIKAFNTAWKYHFPTFVLADGYQGKTQTMIEVYEPQEKQLEIVASQPFLFHPQREKGKFQHLRNTYNQEEELAELLENHCRYFEEVKPEIVEYEDFHTLDAKVVVFAFGIVAAAAKQAIENLRQEGKKVGLFRPITLNPFPKESALTVTANKKALLIIESALGQFERLVKANLYGIDTKIIPFQKPALGFTPEEIVEKINEILKK